MFTSFVGLLAYSKSPAFTATNLYLDYQFNLFSASVTTAERPTKIPISRHTLHCTLKENVKYLRQSPLKFAKTHTLSGSKSSIR